VSAAAKPPTAMRRPRAPALKLALGLAISAAFLYALLSRAPLHDVGAALGRANLGWVAASLLAVCLSYTLKTQRWVLMLRSLGGAPGFRQALTPLMGSVALNNVLPFRAGDIVRVMAFRRYTGVQPSMQLGTVILERLLDVGALLAVLVAVATLWPLPELAPGVLAALRMLALAALAALAGFMAAPRPLRMLVRAVGSRVALGRAGEILLRFSEALERLSSTTLLARLAAFSLAAWFCEGLAYVAVAQSLGAPAPLPAGLLALALGTLSTMIPSSPGYIGTFHYFAALALAQLGAGRAEAAAFAILIHAILWLSTTSVGFLLLFLDRPPETSAIGRAAAEIPEEGTVP
jgi:hypothetical protein